MGPGQSGKYFRKHGIRFASEAEGVFVDDFAITITDGSDQAEERFVTIGMVNKAKVLVVVCTPSAEKTSV